MNYDIKNKILRPFLILDFLFLILALSGCSIPSFNSVGDRKPVPVMLAQECGMDGLKCCATDPSCSYGQTCCVNPGNASENMCADKCEFGELEQFCTADNQCGQGLKCAGGKCESCGADGQSCCQGQTEQDKCTGKIKEGSLVCVNEICVSCGQPGNPCCANDKCFKQGEAPSGAVECRQGNCLACGLNSQPICNSDQKCAENLMINENTCVSCGQFNQPCCRGEKGESVCDKKLKLKCELGFCE